MVTLASQDTMLIHYGLMHRKVAHALVVRSPPPGIDIEFMAEILNRHQRSRVLSQAPWIRLRSPSRKSPHQRS